MVSFDSLQQQFERSFSRARDEMDEAGEQAEDSTSLQDVRAFNEASKRVSVASYLMNEGIRVKQSSTKAIIDGIQ